MPTDAFQLHFFGLPTEMVLLAMTFLLVMLAICAVALKKLASLFLSKQSSTNALKKQKITILTFHPSELNSHYYRKNSSVTKVIIGIIILVLLTIPLDTFLKFTYAFPLC
jgi:hypothetical protein